MAFRSSNPVLTPNDAFNTPVSYSDRFTLADVVQRTVGLLALLSAAGVVGWQLAPAHPSLVMVASLTALALSFLLGFSRTSSPILISTFALVEGLAMGALSSYYEARYSGIVLQAVAGTVLDFLGMLVLYQTGVIRATPRMRKVVYGTLMGVVLLSLLDLALRAFGSVHVPIINSPSPVGVLFTLAILAVASLQFVLDFDYIENAIATGAPKKDAWRAAYGLLIGVVWVYMTILKVLGQLRQ